MALGLGSNLIVRDGGVPGVVVRLGKAFATVETASDCVLECGGGASGILVSSTARDAGIAGLEFLRGIPGTVGGFVRMNGGAYGREVADMLVDCDVVLRRRRTGHAAGARTAVFLSPLELARGRDRGVRAFRGHTGRSRGDRRGNGPHRRSARGIAAAADQDRRLDLQEPAGRKAWQLVDAAGCRGLTLGGAQVSEKHANFLINTGDATSADIEGAGRGSPPPGVGAAKGVSSNGKSSGWGGREPPWLQHSTSPS